MQNAHVFVIEDYEPIRAEIRKIVERSGHKIVLEASTYEEVSKIIESGELEKNGVNLITLDGNFPEAIGGNVNFLAPRVYMMLKHQYPDVKVIALTSMDKDDVNYGGLYLHKDNMPQLPKVIDSI